MNFRINANNEKAITLIVLVITIIVLLILAGITIATLTGENGLFERAKEAKLEAKRAQIKGWLDLKLIEEQSEDIDRTSEEIIIATRENVIKNQNELKQMGKDVAIGEVLNETINEDTKKVNTYFEVIVDGDIYKVEMSGTKFIGNINELVPKITLESITNTTNTITVKVKTERNEGGKIEYYIKGEDEEKYTLKETTTNETYTYLNLEQNKKYNIKIVAVAKNGRTAELLVDRTTGKVADLTTGNTTFEYSTKEWTNGNVIVTAKTTVTGYTLQTSKDGRTWTNTTTQTFTENGTVYARLWDGTNYGGVASGSVTNIDKIVPIIGGVSGSNTTSNVGTIMVSNISDSGGSGVVGYYASTNSTRPTATSVNWIELPATSFSYNVPNNGTYYIWVKDRAGNVSDTKSSAVSGIVNKVTSLTWSNSSILIGNVTTPTLTYTGTPKSKVFTSLNPGIATINASTGEVYGVSDGVATINVVITNYDGSTVTGTATVSVSSGVARILNKHYATVTNAVNDTNNATIYLLRDVAESVTIPNNKIIVLDLGGHTLSSNGQDTIYNYGTSRIENGTINAVSNSGISNEGTLTLANRVTVMGYYYGVAANGGVFSMEENATVSSQLYDGILIQNNANVVLAGRTANVVGKNHGILHKSSGTLTVNRGSITGGLYGIRFEGVGTTRVYDGVITGNGLDGISVTNVGRLEIMGGTIKGKNYGVYRENGTVTMTGGNLIGEMGQKYGW